MKKIPTLFKREFDDNHNKTNIFPEVTQGLEWVINNEGIATIKWDGACCAIIHGELYKRYDAKNGKPIPEGAIKCQNEPDPITGHMPCWVKCDIQDNSNKWFFDAYNYETFEGHDFISDGTYEAIGPHFQGNPYGLKRDMLMPHGAHSVDVERTFEGIRNYLSNHYIEGLVFWKDNEPKCKIKRSDFGFEWNSK